MSDRPGRRDGDELVLHAAAGRRLGIIEAAGQRDAFGSRKLIEDFGLLVLGQVFENADRVVGIEVADAFGDRRWRQLVEDFLADRVVDFGQAP